MDIEWDIRIFPDNPPLPLFHFGDIDPAGFHILAKLRAIAPRSVTPWLMHRRICKQPVPLTEYDRKLLPKLLADPLLKDVHPLLLQIQESGDKGDYEQETLHHTGNRPDGESTKKGG